MSEDKISIRELRKVKGIGPKAIERIKNQIKTKEDTVYDATKRLPIDTITNGDMLEAIKGIPDNSIDLLLTDPPYKIVQGGATNSAFTLTGGKNYSKGTLFDSNDIEFSDWASEVYRVQKEGTHAYVFTNDRNMQELLNTFTDAGYQVLNILAWHKNTHSPNRYYLKNTEFIVMFRKGNALNINNMGSFTSINYTAVKDKEHPSQKPEELLKHLITNSTNEGEIVFDPFSGSGSTILSAISTNRRYIGIELDEEYYGIINKRVEERKD